MGHDDALLFQALAVPVGRSEADYFMREVVRPTRSEPVEQRLGAAQFQAANDVQYAQSRHQRAIALPSASRYARTTTSSLNSRFIFARPAVPIACRAFGSMRAIVSIASASDAASRSRQSRPVTPSSIKSRLPATSVPMSGLPTAAPSSGARDMPSRYVGRTTTVAARMYGRTS